MQLTDIEVRIARTDDEIDACFPIISDLRPHLRRAEFLGRVREMERAGYTLAFLSVRDRPVAVAGYRIKRMLCCDPFLYVDDMVTTARERSHGYGTALLKWLIEQAREMGCSQVHLDSGVQREDARRFYERNGFVVTGFHFRINAKVERTAPLEEPHIRRE